jgi:hypothetical protein
LELVGLAQLLEMVDMVEIMRLPQQAHKLRKIFGFQTETILVETAVAAAELVGLVFQLLPQQQVKQ